LDTALRRRFEFKHTPPQPEMLSKNLDGIDLQNLLSKLNATLKDKVGQDHQVGHAWFPLAGKKDATAQDVVAAFKNKILPLLEEWFYDDEKGKLEVLAQFTQGGEVTVESLKSYSTKPAKP
jgi:5-methylcytosine-specific restriction protein B